MLHLYVDRLHAAPPRAIPHSCQNRKEEVADLHVRNPQYERLHHALDLLTCRAERCLTDSDRMIPWVQGKQPPGEGFDDEPGWAISDS